MRLDGKSISTGRPRKINAEAKFQVSNVREPILSMGKLGDSGYDFVTKGRSGHMVRGDLQVPMRMRRKSWYIEASIMALSSAGSARDEDAGTDAAARPSTASSSHSPPSWRHGDL